MNFGFVFIAMLLCCDNLLGAAAPFNERIVYARLLDLVSLAIY